MKKLVVLILTFLIVALSLAGNVFAEPKDIQKTDFKIKYCNQIIELTMPAYTIDGNTYISVRDIGNIFTRDVAWNNDTKSIDIKTPNNFIPWKGEKTPLNLVKPETTKVEFPLRINGTQFSSNKSLYIINNRVYVPLIDITHSMHYEIWWNKVSNRFILSGLGGRCINSKNYIFQVVAREFVSDNELHKHQSGYGLIKAFVSITNKEDDTLIVNIPDDLKVKYSNGEIKPIQTNGNDYKDSIIEIESGKGKTIGIYFEVPESDKETTLIFKTGEDEGSITFDVTIPDSRM